LTLRQAGRKRGFHFFLTQGSCETLKRESFIHDLLFQATGG
jgi:hypothetical protein